jgi:ABC-type multidrug transport system ATPase subunit
MDNMIDIPMKHLSKGTLQKVGVVQAFLTKPDVLLLDEPLSGQDIKSQNVFISLAKELSTCGVTIVMACHERFLTNSLSDTSYEIKNNQLYPLLTTEQFQKIYDVLIFMKSEKCKDMNEELIKMIEKIEQEKELIKLVVQKENSNEIITKMLASGYILRRMYSE